MGEMKKLGKWILIAIVFYLFTMLLTYVGFNSAYRNIDSKYNIPEQIKIDIAQTTKVNGRIFGEVTSTEDNDLNGKYIEIQIYNKKDEIIGIKYLKIEDTNINEPKKFVAYFNLENVASYSVDIVDDSEELQERIKSVTETFKDVFTDKEIAKSLVWAFVLWGIFF